MQQPALNDRLPGQGSRQDQRLETLVLNRSIADDTMRPSRGVERPCPKMTPRRVQKRVYDQAKTSTRGGLRGGNPPTYQ